MEGVWACDTILRGAKVTVNIVLPGCSSVPVLATFHLEIERKKFVFSSSYLIFFICDFSQYRCDQPNSGIEKVIQ